MVNTSDFFVVVVSLFFFSCLLTLCGGKRKEASHGRVYVRTPSASSFFDLAFSGVWATSRSTTEKNKRSKTNTTRATTVTSLVSVHHLEDTFLLFVVFGAEVYFTTALSASLNVHSVAKQKAWNFYIFISNRKKTRVLFYFFLIHCGSETKFYIFILLPCFTFLLCGSPFTLRTLCRLKYFKKNSEKPEIHSFFFSCYSCHPNSTIFNVRTSPTAFFFFF